MERNADKVFVQSSESAAALVNGAGSALFVINLCASMAPLAAAGKTLPGFDNQRLYQVARAEDGRTRYRLRLGFFTSEADAEQVLAAVRDQYPTAFTACLADEDRKFARGYVPEAAAAAAAAARPAMTVVVDNDSTRPVKTLQMPVAARTSPASAAVQPTAIAAPAAAPLSQPAADAAIVEIDWEPAPVSAKKSTDVGSKAAALSADAVEIEMAWEPPAKPAVASGSGTAVPPRAASTTVKSSAASTPAPAVSTAATAAPVIQAAAAQPVTPALTIAASKVTQSAATVPPAITASAKSSEAAKPTRTVPSAQAAQAAGAPSKPAAAGLTPPAATGALAGSLELATTNAPLSTTSEPWHRGVVASKAPALDSIQLTLDTEAAVQAAPKPSSATSQQPFHVGKGVDLPATSLSLESANASSPAIAAAAKPATSRDAPAAPATRSTQQPAAPSLSLPDLDSTQTIRALTEEELNDESQEKCFAIQLAVSDQPVNLEAMPHLDIFEAYRLYSIATAGSGKITHSLRIGFFREAVSAEAVSGYLRTFFPSPTIVRISLAEQARFKEPPVRQEAAPVAPNDGKVVALSDARARNARAVIPTVTMEVKTPLTADTAATGSFRPNATGSFKTSATGSFKTGSTGSFKPDATGSHKAMKPAAKTAATPTKRSAPVTTANKHLATGKHKALPKKPLSQQLADEARDVELSESGIMKIPKSSSLLARLVGKLSR
jgi:hypothetical protein